MEGVWKFLSKLSSPLPYRRPGQVGTVVKANDAGEVDVSQIEEYDVVIIGGGTAGCVLAARSVAMRSSRNSVAT